MRLESFYSSDCRYCNFSSDLFIKDDILLCLINQVLKVMCFNDRAKRLSVDNYELILQKDDIGEARQILQSPLQQELNALLFSETSTECICRDVSCVPGYDTKNYPGIGYTPFIIQPNTGQPNTITTTTSTSHTEIKYQVF